MEKLIYLFALRSINGVGNKMAERLIEVVDSPKDIFSLSIKELASVEGLRKDIAKAIKNFNNWKEIEKTIENVKKYGFKIYTILDDEYPRNLLKIYEKPTFIYVFGELIEGDQNAVAMVGSRFCNNYGKNVARKLSIELARKGVTVVSGMARGIDSISHRAAIEGGGRTIAVMGSGLDRIYPPENSKLYKLISENGAVISEFPMGMAPDAQNFPRRNRIISGLSKGVVIVQASRKSGSLITANFALEQNREVFAVPGNVGNKMSEGANSLIKRGAMLIEDSDDIINVLNLSLDFRSKNKTESKNETLSLQGDEKLIVDSLGSGRLNIDEIIDKTKIYYKKLFPILLELELKGILEQLPGKIYQVKY